MTAHSDGGKTSPRLFYDLLRYFPQVEQVDQNRLNRQWCALPHNSYSITELPSNPNASSDLAPSDSTSSNGQESVFEPNNTPLIDPLPILPSRHTFFLKQSQSSLPESVVGLNIKSSSKFCAAILCNTTRFHFDLEIDFAAHNIGDIIQPCGTPAGAFTHHFVHINSNSLSPYSSLPTGRIPTDGLPGRWGASHTFRCSQERCRAQLRILVREPIISDQTLDHLINLQNIKTRYDLAVGAGIVNVPQFAPLNILRNLLVYINNSLKDGFEIKTLTYFNKVFYTMFGDDCVDFLEYIGFESVKDSETGQYICWNTPSSANDKDRRTLLEDIREELICLISQRPMVEYTQNPTILNDLPTQTTPAGRLLADVFGCSSYSNRSVYLWDDNSPEVAYVHPYDILGVLPDFDDDWIAYAFDCQCKIDSKNVPKYLDAIQVIAELRSSDSLLTKAALIISQGYSTLQDINTSYAAFNLPLNSNIEDDAILAAFYAAASEATPEQDLELRDHLYQIGEHRSSQQIVTEAMYVGSYEQAMLILNVQSDSPDDVVISTAVAKNLEYSDTARSSRLSSRVMEALKVIASSRDSSQIRRWLENLDPSDDDADNREMDVSQAYNSFNITDMNSYVDPETLELTKENFICDRPQDFGRISMAYEKIATHNRLMFPDGPLPQPEPEFPYNISSWPVGLDNIGNTCYLNSILQYLFTIKGVRDLVLDYDHDELKTEVPANRRVGGRLLSAREVARAQRFVRELRRLFEEMVSSPFPVIRPERELAVLTLMRPDDDDLLDPVVQPSDVPPPSQTQPPNKHAAEDDDRSVRVEGYASATGNSDTSDTLVDDIQYQSAARIKRQKTGELVARSAFQVDDDEDPSELLSGGSPPVESHPAVGLPSPSGSRRSSIRYSSTEVNIRSLRNSPSLPSHIDVTTTGIRDTESNKLDSFTMAEYAAQQQDVTEVMKNVLFQLEAAIPGNGETYDENGEQDDLIKELFFMKVLWSRPDGTTKEEVWNDVIVYLPEGPRTIYSALDAEFDPHTLDLGNNAVERYGSLKKPPVFFQVNVSRVDFDPIRNVAFKVEHHLDLVETLYLDRYLQSDDPKVLERRRQGWKLKAEIAELKQQLEDMMDSRMALSPIRPSYPLRSHPPPLGSEMNFFDECIDIPDQMVESVEEIVEKNEDGTVGPVLESIEGQDSSKEESVALEMERLETSKSIEQLTPEIQEDGKEQTTVLGISPGEVTESYIPITLETSAMGQVTPIPALGGEEGGETEMGARNISDLTTEIFPPQSSPPRDDMDVDPPSDSEPWGAKMDRVRKLIVQKSIEHMELFEDMQTEPYHLFAQFMHQGVSSGGHYWINIRDLETNMWRQYNDSNVTELNNWQDAVFKQTPRWPATPYFLVYVRGNILGGGPTSLTDPVCRKVDPELLRAPPQATASDERLILRPLQDRPHPVSPVSVALSDSGLDSDAMQLSPSLNSSAGTLGTEVDAGKSQDLFSNNSLNPVDSPPLYPIPETVITGSGSIGMGGSVVLVDYNSGGSQIPDSVSSSPNLSSQASSTACGGNANLHPPKFDLDPGLATEPTVTKELGPLGGASEISDDDAVLVQAHDEGDSTTPLPIEATKKSKLGSVGHQIQPETQAFRVSSPTNAADDSGCEGI